MLELTLTLLLFLAPLAYSPGPGNMVFAANGARFGFRATIPANIGYHIATWLVTAAIGFGLIGALHSRPALLEAIRIAGALYVFWLAWGLFRAGALDARTKARPVGFGDGIVLLMLNPKAYVIIVLMFTQFLGTGPGNGWAQILLITTVFTLNNMLAFSLWAQAGDTIARYFRHPLAAARLNRMLGLILACVALWMLLG